MMTEVAFSKRIWGLQFEEVLSDDYLIWRTKIKNPFYNREKAKWIIGLNEKFLREAITRGVKKIIVQVGQKEIIIPTPTEKELKIKDRKKEFELKESLFENSPAMKIYYFEI